MSDRSTRLRGILEDVFMRANSEVDECDRVRGEFIVHMTDWEKELFELSELYAHPENFSTAEAEKIVARFLYHASGHILRAAHLQYDYDPSGDE